MKIKNNKVNYKSFFLISIALLILFLLSFGFKQRENNKKSIKAQKKEKLDLETKTIIDTENSIINVIKEDIGIIHKDKICTIHLFKELGTPTILYVYRDSLSLEQLTDRFYLQVHLKNPTLWNSENNKAFIPLDFNARPKEIVIGDKKFFTFKKEFTHEYLDLGNVKHISTGRFKAGRGKSYSLGKIKIQIAPVDAIILLDGDTVKNGTYTVEAGNHLIESWAPTRELNSCLLYTSPSPRD